MSYILPESLRGLNFTMPRGSVLDTKISTTGTIVKSDCGGLVFFHKLGGMSLKEYLIKIYGKETPIEVDCLFFAQLFLLAESNIQDSFFLVYSATIAADLFYKLNHLMDKSGTLCCLNPPETISDCAKWFNNSAQWLVRPSNEDVLIGIGSDEVCENPLDAWKKSLNADLIKEAGHFLESASNSTAQFADTKSTAKSMMRSAASIILLTAKMDRLHARDWTLCERGKGAEI